MRTELAGLAGPVGSRGDDDGSQPRYRQRVDARPDTSWMERIPSMRGPWDDPDWRCCPDDPDCPFVEKCRDSERMDAAYIEWRAERDVADGMR